MSFFIESTMLESALSTKVKTFSLAIGYRLHSGKEKSKVSRYSRGYDLCTMWST